MISLDSCRAEAGKCSYLSGGEISVRFIFAAPIIDLAKVTNISVDLQKVERARNQSVFGFGAIPTVEGNAFEVKQKLPNEIPIGLYLIDGVTICWGDGLGPANQQHINFDPIFFAIQTVLERALTGPDVATMIANAEMERHAYINHPLQTKAMRHTGGQGRKFGVLVFGVGCLLHSHQQLEGYALLPLRLGMSYRRPHEIVNKALSDLKLEPLKFDPVMEGQFESGTPTFAISYQTVVAVDQADALDYCRSHSALVFELLGLDRGQKPREFACVASEFGTNLRWHLFQQPWYKGNLVSDFNPGSTANLIERHIPRLEERPFLRLIVKTYADGTGEDDHGFALLRFWSVMELIADRSVGRGVEVKNPDGSPIFNGKGEPVTTKSKVGRVYSHILSMGAYLVTGSYPIDGVQKQYMIGADRTHPGYTPETELLSLWEMVGAAYAIRNAIAHEGQFNLEKAASGRGFVQNAARLIQGGYADPRKFIKQQAHLSVMRKLNEPSEYPLSQAAQAT